jgi:hypothetical protein
MVKKIAKVACSCRVIKNIITPPQALPPTYLLPSPGAGGDECECDAEANLRSHDDEAAVEGCVSECTLTWTARSMKHIHRTRGDVLRVGIVLSIWS